MDFKVGDKVYVTDYIEGTIVDIDGELAMVEYSTGTGGGCLSSHIDDLKHVPNRIALLHASKSVHGTVNVMIQNCSHEVSTLLHRFDVWKSNGRYIYDKIKPDERAKIWFECPIEFFDFIESSMGRACFERMGVEQFEIIH